MALDALLYLTGPSALDQADAVAIGRLIRIAGAAQRWRRVVEFSAVATFVNAAAFQMADAEADNFRQSR